MSATSSRLGGFSGHPVGDQVSRNVSGALLFTLAIIVLSMFTGCTSAVALEHARDQRSASLGDSRDEDLHEEARDRSTVNYDQWCVQCNILGDDPIPSEAAKRIEAARVAREQLSPPKHPQTPGGPK